jgi:hypothetical protein
MEVRFGSAAQRELEIASGFYDEQRPGLGDEFLDEVNRHIILLKEHPRLGRLLFARRRMLMLNRFPYRLIYFQEENLIRIIAIAHESRRPYYWRHRIEERRPAYAALSARLRSVRSIGKLCVAAWTTFIKWDSSGSDAFFPIYNVRHSTAAEHKR